MQKNRLIIKNLFSEPIAPAELDSFIGQGPANAPSPFQTYSPSSAAPLDLTSHHSQQSPQQQSQQSQPPKQSYLTSILSSLPNLNLSNTLATLTGDDRSSNQSQNQSLTGPPPHPQQQQNQTYGQPQGFNNPYNYQGNQGLVGGDFNASVAVSSQANLQPQAPPTAALPPVTGGLLFFEVLVVHKSFKVSYIKFRERIHLLILFKFKSIFIKFSNNLHSKLLHY